MRIYVHFPAGDAVRVVLDDSEATVSTVLARATAGRVGRWSLAHDNASRRTLRPSMAARDAIDDNGDVVAVLAPGSAARAAAAVKAAAPQRAAKRAENSAAKSPARKSAPSATPKAAPKAKAKELSPEQRIVEQQLAQQLGCPASEVRRRLLAHGIAFVRGVGGASTSLKKARAIFEQIIALYPADAAAAGHLADIHLENERWSAATRVLTAARAACGEHAATALCARLGEAHFGAHRWDDSANQYARALQTSPARALLKAAAGGAASDGAAAAAAARRAEAVEEIDTLTIRLAMAHYEGGREDEGIRLIESVVHRREDHMEGLLAYARAAAERGKRKDAMGILLRAVVLDQNHKAARRRVGVRLRETGGLAALMENFPAPSPSLAPAFAFLATMAKDEGAIDASLFLFEAAARSVSSCVALCARALHFVAALVRRAVRATVRLRQGDCSLLFCLLYSSGTLPTLFSPTA